MQIINTQEELEALIDDNGNIVINDDLMLKCCDIKIEANIICFSIEACNIEANNINAAGAIKLHNIKANNISCYDIKSWNISCYDINAAGDIDAFGDIEANNINSNNIIAARSIKAADISYFAFCFARNSIICKSIKGRRDKSRHFVLEGTITETNKQFMKIKIWDILEIIVLTFFVAGAFYLLIK